MSQGPELGTGVNQCGQEQNGSANAEAGWLAGCVCGVSDQEEASFYDNSQHSSRASPESAMY